MFGYSKGELDELDRKEALRQQSQTSEESEERDISGSIVKVTEEIWWKCCYVFRLFVLQK